MALACPCFVLRLIGLETKNVLDYQGRAGDHFHCTVERSPGHIRCRIPARSARKVSKKSPNTGFDVFFDSFSGPAQRARRSKKKLRFRARVNMSSENEIFERATHATLFFCGEIETSRSKFASEIQNFDRD